ncbi:MAG: TatD family hydrolase [Clostridia bacterium]
MKLFDAHCHLDDAKFNVDRGETITRMHGASVSRCILAGSDRSSSEQAVALARANEGMYAVVGVHPHEAKGFVEDDLRCMAEWLTRERVVGVGEIGLDYFYDFSPRDVQQQILVKQLLFARERGVPVVLHVRDAHGDMIGLLKAHKNELPEGMLHCYSGSVESAREYLDLGFYLSFAGPVTFTKSAKLKEVAVYCPKERLLVETDSPYLAPVPMRGKRNEPAHVRYVAEEVARLRGVTLEELAQTAMQNTCRLFGIAQE